MVGFEDEDVSFADGATYDGSQPAGVGLPLLSLPVHAPTVVVTEPLKVTVCPVASYLKEAPPVFWHSLADDFGSVEGGSV